MVKDGTQRNARLYIVWMGVCACDKEEQVVVMEERGRVEGERRRRRGEAGSER